MADELERAIRQRDLGLLAEPRSRGVQPRKPGLLDLPGGVTERLALLNQFLNPVEAIGQSMQSGERMMQPNMGGYDRLAALGDMLSGVAGVAGPAVAVGRVGAPAAAAVMEGLLGFSPTTQAAGDTMRAAGRDIVDRLNQPGPVPVMYSNPIPRAPFDMGRGMGDNGGPSISPLSSVNLPAGSDPRYRGAAPNRTEEYPRYSPKEVPERMRRLIASADDPSNPINSLFDNYIERGNKLGGQDWYNTEEMRDWFVNTLGEQTGDARWREFVRLVGATSTGSDVASNLRNASFYNALEPGARVAVASRVSQGGITPAAAARELGLEPLNTPTNYNYGHVMQGNHAKNVLAQSRGEWEPKMPEGLTKGQQSDWLKANPKVKGFANDLLGSEANIAADKHFMRMLAMSDGGTDFLTEQAQLSASNLEKLRAIYGEALNPYIKTRKTGTGALVVETNLAKAVKDGVITDTAAFSDMPTAWLDVPKDGEYAALEEMAQRMGKRYGMTPAQFQAALWMGAGDITGLADESQGTAMELFRRTLDKRAKERGLTREQMLSEFIMNRAPLAIAPGGVGLLAMQPNEEQY
jgi:hypothetical protein